MDTTKSQSGKFFLNIDKVCLQSIDFNFLDLLDKECSFINEKFVMALDDFLQAEKKRFFVTRY